MFFPLLVWAQAPTATPRTPGFIRFWDMLPSTNGSFQLLDTSTPKAPPIATANAYAYSNYRELPAGKYRLAVVKRGTSVPLKAFDVNLSPNTFFTILVSPGRIDAFEDTLTTRPQAGSVTLRNYFPNTTVRVTQGKQVLVESLGYGQSTAISGLPLVKSTLLLETKLPDGKSAQSFAETDLKSWPRVTVLIFPDPYGRFRPRVVADGKNP
ncbi:MAG: DUF4397 domain-containing protein [Verrucomicrobiota bacterium]|nr:DUF4397 domain-containing protein [Verrucomicrobiota bacterium]